MRITSSIRKNLFHFISIIFILLSSCSDPMQIIHTVNFYDHENNLLGSVNVTYANTLTGAPAIENLPEGKEIDYWYYYIDGSETCFEFYFGESQVLQNMNLYPQLKNKEYKVTILDQNSEYIRHYYVGHGQTLEEVGAAEFSYNPDDNVYVYKYLSLEKDGEEFDLSTPITGNMDLYAVYEYRYYKITFMVDGQLYRGPYYMRFLDQIDSLSIPDPKPSEEDKYFVRWYDMESDPDRYFDTVIKDATLVPLWGDIFCITYMSEGKVVAEKKYKERTSLSSDEVFYEIDESSFPEGKYFMYWADENGNIVNKFESFSGDKTVHAVWGDKKAKVIFYDHEHKRIEEKQVTWGETIIPPDALNDYHTPGYDFIMKFQYWSESRDGEQTPFDFENTPIREDKVFYPVYARYWTVSFAGYESIDVKESNTVDDIGAPEEKDGYVFKGWYDSSTREIFDFETPVENEIHLYPVWLKENKVSFNLNKPDQAFSDIICEAPTEIIVLEGETIEETEIPVPSLDGYTFMGWYTDEEMTEEADFSEILTTNDKEFHARWEKNVLIKFISKIDCSEEADGVTGLEERTISYDSTVDVSMAKLNGYEIEGYYSDENFTQPLNIAKTFTEDTTIYVNWTAKDIKITYVFGNGIDNIIKTVKFGNRAIDVFEKYKHIYIGHSFDGWYKNEDYTGEVFDFSLPVDEIKDFTLYVKWKEVPDVELRIYDYFGSSDYEIIKVPYGTNYTPESPEKEYAVFTGWEYREGGSNTAPRDLTLPLLCMFDIKYMELYPVWLEIDIDNFRYNLNSEGNGYIITDYIDYNKNLTEVIVPSEIDGIPVVAIGANAFAHPESKKQFIETIILPDTIKEIGNNAFYNQTNLSKIEIPEGVTRIENTTFKNCSRLNIDVSGLVLPDTIEYIGEEAFAGCTGITKLIFNEGLKEISSNAFSGCNNITEIHFPDSLEILDSNAFNNCYLSHLKISGTIPNSKNGLAYFESIDSLTIEDCERIGSYAFWGTGLQELNLTNVKEIGDSAFVGHSLTLIEIPESVEKIESGAFTLTQNDERTIRVKMMSNATIGSSIIDSKEIIFIDGTKYIPSGFFNKELLVSSSIERVVIPDGVKVGSNIFIKCTNLKEIVVPWKEDKRPSTWASDWLGTASEDLIIYNGGTI